MLRDSVESVHKAILTPFRIILALQAHPEFRKVAEKAGEQQGRFYSNGSLTVDEYVSSASIHAYSLRKAILNNASAVEKLVYEEFTMMDG